ncbi:manganese-dependent ADP-ribose/CDP-alcohol diphosphatase isoform X2 [Cheilinus undulatus]|uniref:manganese-dependent ADP-ribose/CDP-alcohol diphosphatase isoform X2 n=1 Tax=Cheilinus undulatus TaxID=241271 RepID=UPI001BD363E7|nr:manganese-dependent ADP-ribose/CDP-alcohol diphosphatase isoform X2 [Cheilinus undulatus]
MMWNQSGRVSEHTLTAVKPETSRRMENFPEQTPLFTFGVIADIQYADMDDGFNFTRTRRRYYRSSLKLLKNALKSWGESAVKPDFILQLGDIIDGFNKNHEASDRALDAVLEEFSSGPAEVHHVWGNHEFYNFSRSDLLRSRLNSTLHSERSLNAAPADCDLYAYSFSPVPGFTVVILDGYDVSLLGREESSDRYKDSLSLIRQHNHNEDLNCPVFKDLEERYTMFNGGFSKIQLQWLDSLLTSADENGEKVTVVCHLPVHPSSTTPICLAWNYDELLSILRSHRSVVCFMAGHDHDGGYHKDKTTGTHHLTLEGVIETPPDSDAFATVSVYEDRMELRGYGRVRDRVLQFP